jgi:small subunit ribosomal protein S21
MVSLVMIEVKIQDQHNFERAMRIFKKACQKDGFMMELKDRQYYSKPSEKKRFRGKKTR